MPVPLPSTPPPPSSACMREPVPARSALPVAESFNVGFMSPVGSAVCPAQKASVTPQQTVPGPAHASPPSDSTGGKNSHHLSAQRSARIRPRAGWPLRRQVTEAAAACGLVDCRAQCRGWFAAAATSPPGCA